MSPYDRQHEVKLFGNWQSCLQDDNTYGERIYDHVVGSKFLWTFHMGPMDELAFYSGSGPEDDLHDHDNTLNLLMPAYRVFSVSTWKGKRNWSIPSFKLHISVVSAGGSRDECESFIVKIEGTR